LYCIVLQIERYEETLGQIQNEYEKTQEQFRRAHADVSFTAVNNHFVNKLIKYQLIIILYYIFFQNQCDIIKLIYMQFCKIENQLILHFI
jgi:hypothetical protein